jgi:hypothetical protein
VADWLTCLSTRFFIYQVHASEDFLIASTRSSGLYLAFCKLLVRVGAMNNASVGLCSMLIHQVIPPLRD